MFDQFRDSIVSLGMTGGRTLVAVSGGLDSTVLLDLMLRSGCRVGIAHANFQLRGQASMDDEAWVIRQAEEAGIPYFVRRFETKTYAAEHGLSTQMAARDLRYSWFEETMNKEKFDFLATAHHLNDSLETFLLNFVRGAGLSGLKGIPQVNGKIVRPLHGFTREALEGYARAQGLRWREDVSNESDDYHRNFVRHKIVPLLKELNPALEETFKRNCERLAGADELMHDSVSRLRKSYVEQHGSKTKISKGLLGLFNNPAPVLLEFVKEFGFTLDQCREVVLAAAGQPGKHFLSKTHQLVIDRDDLIVSQPGNWNDVQMGIEQKRVILGHWVMEVEHVAHGEILPDKDQAVLAADKLKFPLTWRKWKAGDFFYPLGMDHKKKLSDFLIDEKVSLADKDDVMVLISGEDIVWVVGRRIDNRYRISEGTKEAVVFTLGAIA